MMWSQWAPGLEQFGGYQRGWLRGDVVAASMIFRRVTSALACTTKRDTPHYFGATSR